MPGSYAHITLVDQASEKRRLRKIKDFPREAINAAGLQAKFLELGCISPDYPYLDIMSGDSKKWADSMHYTHTCRPIYIGAELVRGYPKGIARDKCLAWLMGYTAHVVTDMCIHPVVEIKVGSYNGHETQHRRCEMHQDAYIFRRLGTGMPQTAEHIRSTILKCGSAEDPKTLDRDVKGLWAEALKRVYPDDFVGDPPDLDKWHRRCYTILEKLLPTSSRMVAFARHVCDGLGFYYPTSDELDQGYIRNLKVPSPKGDEKHMDYDDIFDWAIGRVQQVWLEVTRYALGLGNIIQFRDQEWNLDTGRIEHAEEAKIVFWGVA